MRIIILISFYLFISIECLEIRLDCYPDSISAFSKYSKESCLSRNCLYDDQANSSTIQCYIPPSYGYILQNQNQNQLKFYLKRNQALQSLYPEPIENVILEVQYYTNDIIRFRIYDADQQRYEVNEQKQILKNMNSLNNFRFQLHFNLLRKKSNLVNTISVIHRINLVTISLYFQ